MATPLNTSMHLEVTVPTVNLEQTAINTFHLEVVSVGAPPATDDDVAGQISSIIATDWKAMVTTNSEFRGVGVRIMFGVPAYVMQTDGTNSGPGISAPPDLPRQVTGITTWRTDRAGKGQRGRTYWPFPAVSFDTGDGTPTGIYLALVKTISDHFIGDLAVGAGGRSALLHWVLYHRAFAGNPAHVPPLPPRPATFSRILGYSRPPKFATQRRRGSYGRQNPPPF